MKKCFLKIAAMCAVMLSSSIMASGTDVDIDFDGLFGISPTKPQKQFDTSNITPGVNILTGSSDAFTFDDADASEFFYNADKRTAYQFNYGLAENEDMGKVYAIKLDRDIYNSVYDDNSVYAYSSLTADFTKAIDRPVYIYFDTLGNNQKGVLYGENGKSTEIGSISGTEWTSVSANSKEIFDGSTSGIRLQYATRPSDCSNVQYFDNIAVFPYYKITYKASYPDGTSGEDEIKYFFDGSDISVTADGKVTGLPEAYLVEETSIGCIGYDLSGFTTKEGGSEAMSEISLSGKDIELYPIWEESTPIPVKIYFDADKTDVISKNLFHGETLKLPSYNDFIGHTPKGKYPTGFEIDGKHYEPGSSVVIPKCESFEATAIYADTLHQEYGELVVFEDFDSIADGTYIYNPSSGVDNRIGLSYVNPAWSDKADHFKLQYGDYADYTFVTDDGTGNHVLATRKRIAAESWPQFLITNSAGTTPEGYYTLLMEFAVPEEHLSDINGIEMRLFYTDTEFEQIGGKYSASDLGTFKKLSISLPIQAGSASDAIKKFQIFAYTTHNSDQTTFYIDNIALYCKAASAEFIITENYTQKVFFTPGETITLPYLYEVYDKLPEGKTLTGFRYNGKMYAPGESFVTSEGVTKYPFEAVWVDTEYKLKFDIGGANGTLAEIPVTDGDTVTLPDSVYHPTLTLVGWKQYGTGTIYGPGDSFTFQENAENKNLDGTNRLVFTAVYNGTDSVKSVFDYNYKLTDGMFAGASDSELSYIKLAYGAGIIPASDTFDADASVSVNDLLNVAERLYSRSHGTVTDFVTEEERLADLVSKGVCGSSYNSGANATYADAAVILANTLSANSYPEIAFNVTVKGLEEGNDSYAEALKLIRAGILPESTNFSKEITYGKLVEAVAKTVQPEIRETENKRRLWILGDSLTDKTTIGWPTKLDTYLDGNLEIINYGVGGWDTSHYLDMNNYSHQNYLDILRRVAPGDYVIIALGTNDSTLWGRGHMAFETSRDNFYKYASQVLSEGGIPLFVCPVGRNNTDENGNYIESDPRIIECMKAVNTVYGTNISIVNFKEISFDRLAAMTADERLEIYRDNVHYTQDGAKVVAGWFDELVTSSTDVKLSGLASHLTEVSFDFDTEDNIYNVTHPVTDNTTSIRIEAPSGIRFKASIDESAREITDDTVEYGFIVARSDILGGKELTHGTDVTYVTGVSYNNALKTDIIYGVNEENGDISFTGVMINIPENKAALTTKLTVRSFVKVGCSYFYGDTHEDSIYDAAKRLGNTDSEYVKKIIDICES